MEKNYPSKKKKKVSFVLGKYSQIIKKFHQKKYQLNTQKVRIQKKNYIFYEDKSQSNAL